MSKFVGWNFGYNGTYSKKQIEFSSFYFLMVLFQMYRGAFYLGVHAHRGSF